MPMIDRRLLITGLISFVAAPAIVRASSLMPLRSSTGPIIGPVTVTLGFDMEVAKQWILDEACAMLTATADAISMYGSFNAVPTGYIDGLIEEMHPRKTPVGLVIIQERDHA